MQLHTVVDLLLLLQGQAILRHSGAVLHICKRVEWSLAISAGVLGSGRCLRGSGRAVAVRRPQGEHVAVICCLHVFGQAG